MNGGSYPISITTTVMAFGLVWILWSYDPKQRSHGGGPRNPVIQWFPPVTYRLASLLVLLAGIGVAGLPFIQSLIGWAARFTASWPVFGNGWLAILGGMSIVMTFISLIRNTVSNTALSIAFATPLLTPFVTGISGDGSRAVLDWIAAAVGGAVQTLVSER